VYTKHVNQPAYETYFKKYKTDGTEYPAGSLPPKFAGQIDVPLNGNTITVQVKFVPQPDSGVSTADVDAAKTKLENGVQSNWNGKFTLTVDDPVCGKKSFKVQYKIVWVTSGQDYTIKIHTTWPREGVTGEVMDVSKTTSAWVYSHEFGHCVGLPDEYAYVSPGPESVKYIKPDGSLDVAVPAPFDGKSKTAPDATIMGAYDCTTVLERHGWTVAIEVQKLLSDSLGRKVKCSISI